MLIIIVAIMRSEYAGSLLYNVHCTLYIVQLYIVQAHPKSFFFRDLKPENLLLDSDGHLKIIDFGFANIITVKSLKELLFSLIQHSAQCALCQVRWPCGQNSPAYATGPYYVAHVVDMGP